MKSRHLYQDDDYDDVGSNFLKPNGEETNVTDGNIDSHWSTNITTKLFPVPKLCSDSATFRFYSFEGLSGCSWLHKGEQRKKAYCPKRNYEGKKIKRFCRSACADYRNCIDAEDEDVIPFLYGCDANKFCVDDHTYTFKTSWAGDQDCDWIKEKYIRRETYCNTRGWDDKASTVVKDACKKACNLAQCVEKTTAEITCKDTANFVFSTQFVGDQDCAWLAQKESRQDKWCDTKGNDGKSDRKIKYFCQKACSSHLDGCKCKDDNNFEFSTEKYGIQDCEWLAKKQRRQEKWCDTHGEDGKSPMKVKYYCSKACNECKA